jgi:carbamoylphosphate synthase large subunit
MKILLLDTSFSSQPIYDYLLKTGGDIYVIGGNPDDFLAKTVKNYICMDYSKVDKVKELIISMAIDIVVPGCNDVSYQVCSKLNQENLFYNIDSVSVNETINNKQKFRHFAESIGLHVPKLIDRKNAVDFLPVIIKPVDAYSGHGITIINEDNTANISAAVKSAKKVSASGQYIIEEFVQGELHSHSAFISDGKIIIDFIVEEHGSVNQFVVDTSYVVHNFPNDILEKIRYDITSLANKLNLCDGLIHTQFILNNEIFWIIEITRRCPGDLYSQLIELSTGFSYAEYYAKSFLNESLKPSKNTLLQKHVIRHTLTSDQKRYYSSLKFYFHINILKFVPLSVTGDLINESPLSRIGLLFISFNTKKDMNIALSKTLQKQLYKIN